MTRAERPRSRSYAERGADVALPAKLGPMPGDAQGAASLVHPAVRIRASTARATRLSLIDQRARKPKRTVKLGAYGTSHPRGARLAVLHALTPAA